MVLGAVACFWCSVGWPACWTGYRNGIEMVSTHVLVGLTGLTAGGDRQPSSLLGSGIERTEEFGVGTSFPVGARDGNMGLQCCLQSTVLSFSPSDGLL